MGVFPALQPNILVLSWGWLGRDGVAVMEAAESGQRDDFAAEVLKQAEQHHLGGTSIAHGSV